MSCPSCFGGGGTQPWGKGSSRAGALPALHNGGNYASLKWLPTERYNYRGGKLYPDPPPGAPVRQASYFFDFRDESCACGVAGGFAGKVQDDGTIKQVFVGLPGSFGPVSRPTTFRRPYKFWRNVPPPVPNGKLGVARQLCSVPVMQRYRPVAPGETCLPALPNGEVELEPAHSQHKNNEHACRCPNCCEKKPHLLLRPQCLAQAQPTLAEKGAELRAHRARCAARKCACVPSCSNGRTGAAPPSSALF